MANYAVTLQRTASTTASVGSLTASNATNLRRFRVYELEVGSEATAADNPFLWQLARVTAAGTSTAVTPKPLDFADAASMTVAGQNHSAEPTYTANEIMLQIPVNQRNTVRWVAAPGGEIVCPATNAAGLGLKTPTATAVVITAYLQFNE